MHFKANTEGKREKVESRQLKKNKTRASDQI